MATTKLTKSQSGTSTNDKKGTFSWWMKRSSVSTSQKIISIESGQERFGWYILSSGTFAGNYRSSSGSPDSDLALTGTPLFRDCNSWYHCVLAWDTSQGTQLNRIRFYVNNVEYVVTQSQTINQDTVFPLNKSSFGSALELFAQGSQNYFDGIVSHLYYVDGQQLTPSTFGETDSTTGEWKIKTSPTVTIGTQGYIILKDGMTITDQSTNSNDFTLASGTLTKTEDCPSNVFCTMNPLDNHFASSTFSNGNNTIVTNNSNYTWNTGTLGMTSGKFYWEVKYSANSTGSYYNLIGIADRPTDNSQDPLGRQTDCSNYGYYGATGGVYAKSTSATTFGNTYTVGDIVGVAVDLDNSKLYFSKNGTWQNSGVPTSGSTGTGAISIDAISSTTTGVYFPASGDWGSSQYATNQHNFGNGYFGTTAVSSAGTNASGIGIFEYDVPAGYTALSTKGLNE